MVVFTVLPKNSGLKRYREIALDSINSIENLEVRGEDVPFWVEELIKKGKEVVGITGQDLYYEYCLKKYKTLTKILKVIAWDDEKALFKKPTLCLLGPKEKSIDTIPKKQRICISEKYRFIAKKYLNLLETKGYTFSKFYVKGSVESSLMVGIADLAIDIVYTGNSMERLGLKVYDKLFYSNVVIIGSKDSTFLEPLKTSRISFGGKK